MTWMSATRLRLRWRRHSRSEYSRSASGSATCTDRRNYCAGPSRSTREARQSRRAAERGGTYPGHARSGWRAVASGLMTAPRSPRAEEVLAHAMRLFAERGYSRTSVADIQKAAGMRPGSGALYKHFASKEALLEAGIDRFV